MNVKVVEKVIFETGLAILSFMHWSLDAILAPKITFWY